MWVPSCAIASTVPGRVGIHCARSGQSGLIAPIAASGAGPTPNVRSCCSGGVPDATPNGFSRAPPAAACR
ncbi:hypothetical protein Y043_6290 [Burkholderia pseudomallei MSHR2138]|nr:hypothetical protein Y043_6290 [Burkholderia pseudomallei MSHR2138]